MDQLSQAVPLRAIQHLFKCVGHVTHGHTDEATDGLAISWRQVDKTYLNSLGSTSKSGSSVSIMGISMLFMSVISVQTTLKRGESSTLTVGGSAPPEPEEQREANNWGSEKSRDQEAKTYRVEQYFLSRSIYNLCSL
jgi:hypothetical protein